MKKLVLFSVGLLLTMSSTPLVTVAATTNTSTAETVVASPLTANPLATSSATTEDISEDSDLAPEDTQTTTATKENPPASESSSSSSDSTSATTPSSEADTEDNTPPTTAAEPSDTSADSTTATDASDTGDTSNTGASTTGTEPSAADTTDSVDASATPTTLTPSSTSDSPATTTTAPQLTWNERQDYLTVTQADQLWQDVAMTQVATGISAGTTLKILRSTQLPDQAQPLLELRTAKGQLLYGWETCGKLAPDAFGAATAQTGYLVITNSSAHILQQADGSKFLPAKSYLNATLTIKAQARHYDGTDYYQVANSHGILGWLPKKAAKLTSAQGTFREMRRYLHLKNSKSTLYTGFTFKTKSNQSYLNRTLLAKGAYYHANGKKYLSLYEKRNTQEVWVGYALETAVSYSKGAQGNYLTDGRYATIKSGNYSIWSSFNWTQKRTSKSVLGKTYRARGRYRHYSGATYLSLYDNKGVWIGYINATAVNLKNGPQGSWQAYNKYVTVTSKGYNLWSNFNWSVKQSASKLKGKTYLVKGLYRHYNGATYYSLHDKNGKWQGYLNAGAAKVAKGKQGIWQKSGQQVILTKQNQPLWQNFSWQKKASSTQYRSKLFTVKGYYQHYNGSRYLSLHDSNGKWYGYINASATKKATSSAAKLKEVQALLNKKYKNANIGIHVMSLTDGQTAQVNGSKTFMAASTGKLPVLYYTQKLINEKKLDPNKKYTYTDKINTMSLSYMRGGAGILQGKAYGNKYSLDTIMKWTCQYSDNQGANFLGYYAANKYDQKMKNEISRILGRKWDRFRYVTAKENTLLLKEMYHNGGQVLNYLSHTTYDSQRLPKYLPVRVAHKIGDLYGYAHDCGIVYTKEPYVISVMTNQIGYETISKISKEVYEIMK